MIPHIQRFMPAIDDVQSSTSAKTSPVLLSFMVLTDQSFADGPASEDGEPVLQGVNCLQNRTTDALLSPPTAHPTSAPIRRPAESLRRHSYERSPSKDASMALPTVPKDDINDPREIILHSFSPTVAVYASADTEELIRLKGIYGGFCGLLQPFGERVTGKVVIRDSIGASRSWDNFGIHFINIGENPNSLLPNLYSEGGGIHQSTFKEKSFDQQSQILSNGTDTFSSSSLDQIVMHYLHQQDSGISPNSGRDTGLQGSPYDIDQYYAHYLRKLLASRPMVPHETFSHPVACVIAISSQSPAPIETLRDLYSETRQGNKRVPTWAGSEFLRYYVLVHDEEHDDIAKSTALFEQMKRHFGLHCHLLRLRSTVCRPNSEDSIELPSHAWRSAEDELKEKQQTEGDFGLEDFKSYLFESDAAAIRTFVREMVTQSIVPFMEGRVTAWNEQVASRRRGISGRFMSLSKRWTGFGSARGSKTTPANATSASGSNYNSAQGLYAPDSPEVTMHRLADYAFMLRDWKLSSSTYDLLRADFGDDKAWRYHASVSEMTAMSFLLSSSLAGSRPRVDTIDQMLDAASYSYLTRCSDVSSAVRCLVLAVELLMSRGGAAAEDAAKWASRLLELAILSPLAQNLLAERIAACYATQPGRGQRHWTSRRRKAALFSTLASNMWLSLGNPANAKARLDDAAMLYGIHPTREELPSFIGMNEYWEQLQRDVSAETGLVAEMDSSILDDDIPIDLQTEQFGSDLGKVNSNGNITIAALDPSSASRLGSKDRVLEHSIDGFS